MWFRRRGIPRPGSNPPFTVVSRRADATPAGYFTPMAEIAFSRCLAASGLLSRLSATEAKTLLAVLSIVTPNGRISATARQVADAIGVPVPVAVVRLLALSRRRWRGRHVIFSVDGGGGLSAYVPSPEIVGQRLGPLETETRVDRAAPGAGSEAVVQASRQRYARPRSVVEAEIERENGGMLPEERDAARMASQEIASTLEDADRHVRERLVKHGVDYRVANDLVRKHGRDRVATQIAYLPYRKAKNAAKMLVSSIEDDYDTPASFPQG